MKKIISLCAALALLLGLTGCAPQAQRFEAQFLTLFDTVTTIVAYGERREEFQKQAQFIHDRLEEYHQLYDIYNEYEGLTNLKTVNDHAGTAPVKVDGRILDLLRYAVEMEHTTGGTVNIAMGSVLSIWHDYRQVGMDSPADAQLPPMAALEAASLHTDIGSLVLDEDASTVYFSDPALRLDVGAIAKGYAVEQVCRQAAEQGFTSGLVSVGGNVYAIGEKNKKPWNVGVRSPWAGEEGEEELLLAVGLSDQALVTSGVYQRYYTVAGVRYHHIIDPATLMPSLGFEAVSILCGDSGQADALSTAVFNLPYEEGLALIEGTDGAEAMWIYPDRSVRYSSGFQAHILPQ